MKTYLKLLVAAVLTCTFLLGSLGANAVELITYYHNDPVGSPLAASDEHGNELWLEHYRPFGDRIVRDSKAADNELWFTGKPQDEATGLSFFGARYYDPVLGRFMAIDPVDFQEDNIHSFNRYAYGNNNPYRFVDPDGRAAETALDVISLGLSVAIYRSDPSLLNGLGVVYDAAATVVPFLPAGFGVIKNVGSGAEAAGGVTKGTKPEISAQKQAGHIPSTPQNTNRLKQGKPTSSFFGEKSGERLTQQAFEKGKSVPGRPNVREHDFGVSTGTGPNGGMQTRVRVHQDSKGRIHGHPSGPEKF